MGLKGLNGFFNVGDVLYRVHRSENDGSICISKLKVVEIYACDDDPLGKYFGGPFYRVSPVKCGCGKIKVENGGGDYYIRFDGDGHYRSAFDAARKFIMYDLRNKFGFLDAEFGCSYLDDDKIVYRKIFKSIIGFVDDLMKYSSVLHDALYEDEKNSHASESVSVESQSAKI